MNVTVLPSNLTATEDQYTLVELLLVVLFVFIFAFGTVGNALAFYFFTIKIQRASRRLKCVAEFLFRVLAVVDFLSSVFIPVLFAYWTLTRYRWYFSAWLCKLVVPLGSIATTMSGGVLCVLAVERQYAILHPLIRRYRQLKLHRVRGLVALVLVYAITINLYYACNITLADGKCSVKDVRIAQYSVPAITQICLHNGIVIFTLLFTYARIFLHMMTSDTHCLLGATNATRRHKSKTRTLVLLAVVTLVFFVLTLPRDILQLVHIVSWLHSNNDGINADANVLSLNSFFKFLHVGNSCVNPLIYYRMQKPFRRFVHRLLFRRKSSKIRKRRKTSRQTSSTRQQSEL